MPEPRRRKPNKKKAQTATPPQQQDQEVNELREELGQMRMLLNRRTRQPVPRGIYFLPFLSRHGHQQLVAVDSRGREVSRARIFAGERERDVAAVLEGVLDEMDPIWTEESDA